MNRFDEFNGLMDVLVGGNYRVWWSGWRGDDQAELLFTVPGQVKQKELTLSALLDYLAKRYGVTSSHPQVAQAVEVFRAKVAALRAEHDAKEAEQQAHRERYEQLYAPFKGMSREELMDEVHRLRNGEDGLLFQQVLQAKDAQIERLEAEVEQREVDAEKHDDMVYTVQQEKQAAYRFAQQVLADNQALKDELAILRAEMKAQDGVDAYDETEFSSDENEENKFPDVDDEEGDTLATTINDQLSQYSEYVDVE